MKEGEYNVDLTNEMEELENIRKGIYPVPEMPEPLERTEMIEEGLSKRENSILGEMRDSIQRLTDALQTISPLLEGTPETNNEDISEVTLIELRSNRSKLTDDMNQAINIIDNYKLENGTPVFGDNLTMAEVASAIEKRIESSERLLRSFEDLQKNA